MPRFTPELVPAVVTPFKPDFSIDFDRYQALCKHLVAHGCDGLLINGTTGESPTLSTEEKLDLIRAAQEALKGKNIPILAGVGTNDTRKAVEEAKKTVALGVEALLVVVPYYNKPSQRGMLEHFRQVAKAVPETEIVIYNIPSRCVVRMEAETMAQLHRECPNIIGVKQSYPDMDEVSAISALLPKKTWLTWCGDDSLSLPMLACGAHGTISVLAHLTGDLLRELIQAFKKGDIARAQEIHLQLLNPGRELFFLPNPTIVKTCLSKLGMMGPTLRPPMVEPDTGEMARIEKLLATLKPLLPSPAACA